MLSNLSFNLATIYSSTSPQFLYHFFALRCLAGIALAKDIFNRDIFVIKVKDHILSSIRAHRKISYRNIKGRVRNSHFFHTYLFRIL